jgi:HSP20 family protein
MLARWMDVNDAFATLEGLRRTLEAPWYEAPRGLDRRLLRTEVQDSGTEIVLTAEVPGLTDKDVEVTLENGVLTLKGERKDDARYAFRFERSYSIDVEVDAERASATVKNGILTVTLPKVPAATPRRIAVSAG